VTRREERDLFQDLVRYFVSKTGNPWVALSEFLAVDLSWADTSARTCAADEANDDPTHAMGRDRPRAESPKWGRPRATAIKFIRNAAMDPFIQKLMVPVEAR
jgi:hypothetical protein